MGRITLVLIGVIFENGKFLITRRMENDGSTDTEFNGYWQFPGGQNEFGESPEEGVRRELKEELGIEVKVSSLIPYVFHEVRNNWHGVFIHYVCERENPHAPIVLNDEADMFEWVTLEEMSQRKLLKGTLQSAEKAHDFITHHVSA